VYLVLGLLAALENVIPPLPTDAAVALGAFLSHRGVTTPLGVFLVIWICNMAGATAVYVIARRYGRRVFATRAGRRVLTPGALARIEREYLRFGIIGIFVARFLPGFRAVVAPFAGLAAIGVGRSLVPMALASALWYGGITILGTALGTQWSRLEAIMDRVNSSLAITGAVATVALVGWWLLRRRRRAREPLWTALHGAFEATPGGLPGQDDEAARAAAMLLLEVAYAETTLMPAERVAVADRVRRRWELPPARLALANGAPHPELSRLASYRERILTRFGAERRIALVERMWQVALDCAVQGDDAMLILPAAELLGLSAEEIHAARERAAAGSRR
jgi:membrane protein DedA with SNARE-associated domain